MFGKVIKIWKGTAEGYVTPKADDDVKTLRFVNKSNNEDPVFAHDGDSGFDLRAWITKDDTGVKIEKGTETPYIVLKSLDRRMIHTGIYCEIPENCEIQIRPRSGLSYKEGISLCNTPATIDSGYTGELCLLVINLSKTQVTIYSGEKIAQAVLCPVYNSKLVNIQKIIEIETDTERGSDGFGSTGK